MSNEINEKVNAALRAVAVLEIAFAKNSGSFHSFDKMQRFHLYLQRAKQNLEQLSETHRRNLVARAISRVQNGSASQPF